MVKEVPDIRNRPIKHRSAKDYFYDAVNKNQALFVRLINLEYNRISIFLMRVALQVCDFSLKGKFEHVHRSDTISGICHRDCI